VPSSAKNAPVLLENNVQLDDFSDGGEEGFLLQGQNRGYTVGAQQSCGSGMVIPDPDFCPSGIPDPGSRIQDPKQQQKRGVKKICCPNFFCSYKNHKIENYINFELQKKEFVIKPSKI
jgi:hypothetical protein